MSSNDSAKSLLSGKRRAAVALVGLGVDRAANVLKKMEDDEVRTLTSEVLGLGTVAPQDVERVMLLLSASLDTMGMVHAPVEKYAREVLHAALGEEKGEALLADIARPAPFAWLAEADPEIAGEVLSGESPSAVALALSHLQPKPAAQLLAKLPESLRLLVAQRIAELDTINVESVHVVDAGLQAKVGTALRAPVRKIVGASILAEILGSSSRDEEKAVMRELSGSEPDLAEAVRAYLFTFDDLLRLDSRALQKILGAVESKDLATAMRGADDELRERIFANVSERAREALEEEISLLQNVKAADVAEARKAVITVVRQQEEEGTITIERADEETV